ncbi:MAG: hypothetical protein ACM335_12175 [Deltaproteobacteria bacterium]
MDIGIKVEWCRYPIKLEVGKVCGPLALLLLLSRMPDGLRLGLESI